MGGFKLLKEEELRNVTALNRRLEALDDEYLGLKSFELLPEDTQQKVGELQSLNATYREKKEKLSEQQEKLAATPPVHITKTVVLCIVLLPKHNLKPCPGVPGIVIREC